MVASTERLERWDDQLGRLNTVVGLGQWLCRLLIAYRKGQVTRALWYLVWLVVLLYAHVKLPAWRERWAENHQSN